MPGLKNRFSKRNRSHLQTAGIVILILIALFQLWFNNANSNQAISAFAAQVYFDGEYRIADGPWQKIVEGEHIPSTRGDVTLRGNFHMRTPDGEYVGIYSGDIPIAFYTDQINLSFYEGTDEPFVMDIENPQYGDSACGAYWEAHLFPVGREDPVEIVIHNPHRFGNETAIDEMLSNVALWTGIDFEREILESGQTQRNAGLFFIIVSFVLVGSALFSALLHIPNNKVIWLLGLTIFSAGIYLLYSVNGVSFWSEFRAVNTSILGFSMMFYIKGDHYEKILFDFCYAFDRCGNACGLRQSIQ